MWLHVSCPFLLGAQVGGGLVADATTQVSMHNEVHEGDEDVSDHDPPLDHDRLQSRR